MQHAADRRHTWTPIETERIACLNFCVVPDGSLKLYYFQIQRTLESLRIKLLLPEICLRRSQAIGLKLLHKRRPWITSPLPLQIHHCHLVSYLALARGLNKLTSLRIKAAPVQAPIVQEFPEIPIILISLNPDM